MKQKRIALAAITGMGAHERDALGPGFDRAVFTARRKAIASLPNLALLTIAGMTPGAYDYCYLEFERPSQWPDFPQGFDLVAISSCTAGIPDAYAVADRCRAAGVPVVMGGPHVSVLPREAAGHCDAVAIGEGEQCWKNILEDFGAGRLKQYYGELGTAFDLADAPMPAFGLLDPDRFNRITIETGRGCPHECEFCASSVLLARRHKLKPAEKVLDELDRVLDIWPRPFIEFADDNTFVKSDYWCALLPELKRRKVRWFAQADIGLAKKDRLLDKMRECGCKEVLIGLESPCVDDLNGLELRANWKRRQGVEPEEAVRRIQSHGIMVNGCFMFGLDNQGPDIFDAVYDFVDKTDLFDVQITILTPFPGTPLYSRLEREGRLLDNMAWERCTLFDVNFKPKNMNPGQLLEGFAALAARLYDDAFTKRRRHRIRTKLHSKGLRIRPVSVTMDG